MYITDRVSQCHLSTFIQYMTLLFSSAPLIIHSTVFEEFGLGVASGHLEQPLVPSHSVNFLEAPTLCFMEEEVDREEVFGSTGFMYKRR